MFIFKVTHLCCPWHPYSAPAGLGLGPQRSYCSTWNLLVGVMTSIKCRKT